MSKKGPNAELRAIANASGFLLQIRLDDEIRSTESQHNWEILATEHPWVDQETRNEGYIDLVLARGLIRIVIECKRARDGNWVFLVPANPKPANVGTLSYFWTRRLREPERNLAQWRSVEHSPESYVADFCAIRGSGEAQKPMLERLGSALIDSVEALALEELLVSSNISHFGTYYYAPMIVTTAQLYVCRFSTKDISLTDGCLPTDKGEFERVPFIRFQHTLTTKLPEYIRHPNITSTNLHRSRSVLVVQAESLVEVLTNWPKDHTAVQ